MKKTRIIALTLVVALVLMGAGYAYWQETLAINTTITTGELDVVFEEGENLAIDYANRPVDYVDIDLDRSLDGDTLTFTLDKLYPGSGGWISFKIKNDGTVPAKLVDLVPENIVDNGNLKDEFIYEIDAITLYRTNRRGGEFVQVPLLQTPIVADNFNDFVDGLEAKLKREPANLYNGFNPCDLVLEPGGYLEIKAVRDGYSIYMPTTITNDAFEGKEFKFDLKLNFTQCE